MVKHLNLEPSLFALDIPCVGLVSYSLRIMDMLVIETVFVFLVITASCESLPVEEADRKKDSNEKTDNSQDWQSS